MLLMIPIAFFLTPPLAGYTENFRNRLFQNYLLFYFSGFVLSQFIKHIAGRVAECGSDFWFLEPVHKLVPEKYLSKVSIRLPCASHIKLFFIACWYATSWSTVISFICLNGKLSAPMEYRDIPIVNPFLSSLTYLMKIRARHLDVTRLPTKSLWERAKRLGE